MVLLHFLKRECETLFVHRFSADTMPLAYIFRNSGHYWALGGVVFGYILYHPSNSLVDRTSTQTAIALALYAYAELSNLYTHLTLRRLRPEGSRVRRIPYGYGFDWPFGGLSCPHYFFEIMAWIVIALWTWTVGILPFMGVAIFIMDHWAQQVFHVTFITDGRNSVSIGASFLTTRGGRLCSRG
jgi:very-long-chain enoyl-CoA reductase